jgi:hypothetical protein
MPATRPLLARFFHMLETAILASLAAGAVIGLLARLAMTAVTLAGGRSNEFAPLRFTLPGLLAIVTQPMLFGIPFTLLLVALWRRLPGAGWAKALSAGVLTFIFPGLLLLTDSSFKINNVNRYLGRPLFAALYFGSGFLAGCVIHYLYTNPAAQARLASAPWRRWRGLILPVGLVLLFLVGNWANAIAFNR